MDFISPSKTTHDKDISGADTSTGRKKKRDRSEAFVDEDYLKNKRILQEGFRSLSLNLENVTKKDIPSYGLYEVHNCPSHDLFRLESECTCTKEQDKSDSKSLPTDSLGPVLEKNQSFDSMNSKSTESDEEDQLKMEEREYMVAMIKGGKRKYVRKVDYLVDELIRKTRKTCDIPVYVTDTDAYLPPNIGPSPRVDQAISILVPFSTHFCSLSKGQTTPVASYGPTPAVVEKDYQPILLSGEVTHGDWGMEEVGSKDISSTPVTCSTMVPYTGRRSVTSAFECDILEDDGNESDMACCEESSHRYSTNSSIGSGDDSGMLVDSDDDEDIFFSSNRSVAFDESSCGAFQRYEHGRHSPWSNRSYTSVKTNATKSGVTDEEDDDVINIGTF